MNVLPLVVVQRSRKASTVTCTFVLWSLEVVTGTDCDKIYKKLKSNNVTLQYMYRVDDEVSTKVFGNK